MKVLIADKVSKLVLNNLKKLNFNFLFDPNLKEKTLMDTINQEKPEVLVVRSKKVFDYHLENNTNLKLIIRAGSGFDNIDIKKCNEKGIIVANCPGKNSIAVSELVSSFILSSSRKLIYNDNLLKSGQWKKSELKSLGIYGKTLGLIGFGNISKRIAERMYPLGLNILANDIFLKEGNSSHTHFDIPELKIPVKILNLKELLSKSDFVSLHIPSTPDNNDYINNDFLSNLKPDSTLINTSRGSIANEEHLLNHINNNKDFTYCTDVFKNEPSKGIAEFNNKLAMNSQVIGTHHIGASTVQSEESVGEKVIEIINEYKSSNKVKGMVNNPSFK